MLGGSLAYDSLHDEVVLFGGGHVENRRTDGRSRVTRELVVRPQIERWRQAPSRLQPPPRMNTRMVTDTRNQVLVLFGGDGQSHYLADTWLYDLKSREWRLSKAPGGPEARAGHFTVYDPQTGWVIIGGGYNRRNLTDMWAYDARGDLWVRLHGRTCRRVLSDGGYRPGKPHACPRDKQSKARRSHDLQCAVSSPNNVHLPYRREEYYSSGLRWRHKRLCRNENRIIRTPKNYRSGRIATGSLGTHRSSRPCSPHSDLGKRNVRYGSPTDLVLGWRTLRLRRQRCRHV